MRKLLVVVSICVLGAVAAPTFATTETLDFSGNICGSEGASGGACVNGVQISQAYGDIAGQLDVSYRVTNLIGATASSSLNFWSTGYSGLTGVAYGGANVPSFRAEITFVALAGYQVSLDSMQFGSFGNASRNSSFTITDLVTSAILYSSSGTFTVASIPSTYTPSVSSTSGLVMTWGPDPFNVGIDNIQLSVTPTVAVPEPESYAMLIAGLGLLGFAARRGKKQSA